MTGIKDSINPKSTMIVVVVLTRKDLKQKIKAQLDTMGVPSQFVLVDTLKRAVNRNTGKPAMSVFGNILK